MFEHHKTPASSKWNKRPSALDNFRNQTLKKEVSPVGYASNHQTVNCHLWIENPLEGGSACGALGRPKDWIFEAIWKEKEHRYPGQLPRKEKNILKEVLEGYDPKRGSRNAFWKSIERVSKGFSVISNWSCSLRSHFAAKQHLLGDRWRRRPVPRGAADAADGEASELGGVGDRH